MTSFSHVGRSANHSFRGVTAQRGAASCVQQEPKQLNKPQMSGFSLLNQQDVEYFNSVLISVQVLDSVPNTF